MDNKTCEEIGKKFHEIGADISFTQTRRLRSDLRIDVETKNGDETFTIAVNPDAEEKLELSVLSTDRKLRHLLLMAKREVGQGRFDKERFLCGHDERHWFVSPIRGSVTSIEGAMESLKPQRVVEKVSQSGLKAKNKHKRHNKAFIRQGEWFFLPTNELDGMKNIIIHKNEPINRAGGKPHMVEELARFGGQTVHVCAKYPNGLTIQQYKDLIEKNPNEARANSWQIRTRNARVYARGKVTHADHSTVILKGWHEVVGNSEISSGRVAFID